MPPCLPRRAVAPQHSRIYAPFRPTHVQSHRPVLVAGLSRSDGLLLGALDKALNQISKLIQDHERKQLAAKSSASGSEPEVEAVGKLVKFSASSSSERAVQEPAPGVNKANRGLDAYLALDLDQYALLDPTWITRPNPDTQPDVFLLKVPLHDLMHLQLEPQVTIKVTIDAPNSKVKFQANSFQLGDARFDDSFTLEMDALLSHKPVSDVASSLMSAFQGWGKSSDGFIKLPERASAGVTHQVTATEIETTLDSTAAQPAPADTLLSSSQTLNASHVPSQSTATVGSNAAAASGQGTLGVGEEAGQAGVHATSVSDEPLGTGTLACHVDMRFSVVMPPPLSVVPGPLLSLAGGLIAHLVLKSLLPAFLELLSVDYVKWATGTGNRQQAAGSLVASAPTAGGPGAAATQAAAGLVLNARDSRTRQGDTASHGLTGTGLGTAMATGVAAAVTLASDAVQTSQ